MKNNSTIQKESASLWLKKLKEADFSALGLSPYHLNYLNRLQAILPHYFSIYEKCFSILFQNLSETEIQKICKQAYIVDYGGGCGFLSLYARAVVGIDSIIYVDMNENSVALTAQIFDYFSLNKPILILGDQKKLAHYCKENSIHLHYLVSTDVIEHIYNLDLFFADIQETFPNLSMVFSTGSNPYNSHIRKKLEAYMIEDELKGTDTSSAFLAQRKKYIETHFNLSSYETLQLAICTRGLIFPEVHAAVLKYQESTQFPLENSNAYECCDPNTGSWTERILPLKEYKNILKKHAFEVRFLRGYYAEERTLPLKSLFFKFLNFCIRCSGPLGFLIAPYMYLKINIKK
ncbi:MAG: hypothetical protein RR256_00775 [Bacteroidales bacterium]